MSISETLLEMHYHRPLMELFRETYGVGRAGKVSFYKYSPQREVFLGFDQAFAMTEVTDEEFFLQLKASALNDRYRLPSRFVAYFLQFKVVSELQKRQRKTPAQIRSRPHYRATLDTTKNDGTGFSQHELLFGLSKNEGAMTYYACPMIFDKAALYEVNVDLDALRLVDLTSCPSDYADNSKHHIYFDQPHSQPIWCSEPVEGMAVTATEFVENLVLDMLERSVAETAELALKLLTRIKERAAGQPPAGRWPEHARNGLALVADSMMIVRVDD